MERMKKEGQESHEKIGGRQASTPSIRRPYLVVAILRLFFIGSACSWFPIRTLASIGGGLLDLLLSFGWIPAHGGAVGLAAHALESISESMNKRNRNNGMNSHPNRRIYHDRRAKVSQFWVKKIIGAWSICGYVLLSDLWPKLSTPCLIPHRSSN